MKRIAIIGAGPTGIYTLAALLNNECIFSISLYEAGDQAGIGMPYREESNSKMMLANITSIEIPPLICTYLEWLRSQTTDYLKRFGVDKGTLHDRQFLPRILLGQYFRDQFLALVQSGKDRRIDIDVHEGCRVTDLKATPTAIELWAQGQEQPALYDRLIIATGHVWPEQDEGTRTYFPSPWSGLICTSIPACRVGIMGTSLSAIDAAMAVAIQHGDFVEEPSGDLRFYLDEESSGLHITLMSRSGILPEADFYCPLPYEPLQFVTEEALALEISAGPEGLLDRIFALMCREISACDSEWSECISLVDLNADSFLEAYFANRAAYAPFRWADYNLREVEKNRREKRTVAWRYAILRLHEIIEDAVVHFTEKDRGRFDAGLRRVFIDNYAAVPPESIRRLLALHAAGAIEVLELGDHYDVEHQHEKTVILLEESSCTFDVFIDARGQKALETKDLPFPTLRQQLLLTGDNLPDIGENYTLMAPELMRGRIAFGALPYLMHDHPFVQGIAACSEIGAVIGLAITREPARKRRCFW